MESVTTDVWIAKFETVHRRVRRIDTNGQIKDEDQLDASPRAVENPFRISVTDVFKGTGGVSATGILETGHIQVGEAIIIITGSKMAVNCKSMQICILISDGDEWRANEMSNCRRLCIVDSFRNLSYKADPITTVPVIIHHQSHNKPGTIPNWLQPLTRDGIGCEEDPRYMAKSSTAIVEIKLNGRAIPLEIFKDSKELGRVMLRKGSETVVAGIVTNIFGFES
ncbi:hypothetical protein BGZ65_001753 [Modicella reniformis]|uniref:GTP-eEF1A C-terminal domain-containing protein n=1 Tax=Modicella reniformis TaxID=1440133 RepID=A0A9P6MIN6_9FUNG|nr:hypothetical protein BGZ65_001753 [Modicella reniformis]